MKEIEFYCNQQNAIDYFPPVPAKKLVPQWYKDLENWHTNQQLGINMPTVKECTPVVDYITSGYIIPNTYEFSLQWDKDEVGKLNHHALCNDQSYIHAHRHEQCPFDHVQSHYFKINQPWVIKTPPGYSCLFVQPFYHNERRFTLLPSIVDTDKHDLPVLFTGYANDPSQPLRIMPGTPLMQVIPFKRDDWQSKIYNKPISTLVTFFKNFHYRNFFHSRKKFM